MHNPSLSNQTLRLAQAVVPIPVEVLGHVVASLQDFKALWQNDAGSTTLLNGLRRKCAFFTVVARSLQGD